MPLLWSEAVSVNSHSPLRPEKATVLIHHSGVSSDMSRSDVVKEDHDELPGFLVAGRAGVVDRTVVDVVRADGRGLS